MQSPTEQPRNEPEGFYRPTQTTSYGFAAEDAATLSPEASHQDSDIVSWEASEYVHRSKDIGWVAGFVAFVLFGLSITIFFQQWVLTILIVVMAIALGIFAFRPPKVKHYMLTHQGLKIDDKMYNLNDFRSFGIAAEEALYSIVLIPVKRFMPAVIVYFAQEDGEKIVDILGNHLPLEELEPDPIDTLMRRLHF